MLQQILCKMGPGDHTIREFGNQFLVGHRHSMLCKPTAHLSVSDFPPVYKIDETALKKITLIINIKTYNMNILSLIFRGKLNSGNNLYFPVLCCL